MVNLFILKQEEPSMFNFLGLTFVTFIFYHIRYESFPGDLTKLKY